MFSEIKQTYPAVNLFQNSHWQLFVHGQLTAFVMLEQEIFADFSLNLGSSHMGTKSYSFNSTVLLLFFFFNGSECRKLFSVSQYTVHKDQ